MNTNEFEMRNSRKKEALKKFHRMIEDAWKYYKDTNIVPDLEIYKENANFSDEEFSEIRNIYDRISENAEEFIKYCRTYIQ